MKRLDALIVLCCGLLLGAATLRCQELKLETLDGRQVLVSRADHERLPHIKVAVQEHAAHSAQFEGVALRSVLESSGVSFGESLKGDRMSNCVLIEAADGYARRHGPPRIGPGIYREAGFIGIFARWETIGSEGGSLPDRHTGREENGALGKAGYESQNCARAMILIQSESSLPWP